MLSDHENREISEEELYQSNTYYDINYDHGAPLGKDPRVEAAVRSYSAK